FKLSDYQGKVVFVFLFGNTCPTCLAAGPSVETDIHQAFKDSTRFAAIGLDTWNASSNESSVEGFKNSTGITFPLALKAGSVAAEYATTYDRLMVIDQAGILVHKGKIAASNDINNAIEAINQSLTVTGVGSVEDGPEVNIFPNPVADVLQIDAGDKAIVGIEIYDVTGKRVFETVYSGQGSSSPVTLLLHSLESGIYFYSIQLEGSPATGKLLIQR
ncbi:MAG: T9SS type A sorting domain-containing protein, partial [Bacteroidales bacterium]|nr:T9SS type A sorting domain-containing protein [Bacteroidales bacterium]